MEDVILGAPWFHCCMATILEFPSRVISFKFRNQDVSIYIEDRGSTIPIVPHASLHKSIKSKLFAYLIFSHESKDDALTTDAHDLQEFLKNFKEC